MIFEKGDLVNFCYLTKDVFFFQDQVRVKDRIHSESTGYYYYFLDQEKFKDREDRALGFGFIREDFIFHLDYLPPIKVLLELMLESNPAIRKEAERVYQKFYLSRKQHHPIYLD